jgi:hypothetical protein
MKSIQQLFLLLVVLCSNIQVHAVETAPRITDREIIESLAELKAGQKSLETTMNQRFESVDQRFDSVDQRFDQIWSLMLVVIGGIFGLIGFIIWDRKTALKPLEQRLDRIEQDLRHDLDIQHSQGSRVTRLINALRELAQKDEKLASVLRGFSLL